MKGDFIESLYVSFTSAEGTHEHRSCLKLDGTLERSGQFGGVEDSATLPVKFFAYNESGQSVGALSSGCNPIPSAINPGVMPYAVRFYACIFVANVLDFL